MPTDPLLLALTTAPSGQPILIAETCATLAKGDLPTFLADASTVLLKLNENAPQGYVFGVAVDVEEIAKGTGLFIPIKTEWFLP